MTTESVRHSDPTPNRYLDLVNGFTRQIAVFARWLHLYLSMFSFAVVLFFAVTGLTLNHPDWFANRQHISHETGVIPAALLRTGNDPHPDKLAIVEHIRQRGQITKPLTEYHADASQIEVAFRAPGYGADAFIDPLNGTYDLTVTRNGALAVINDLHRGQNSGAAWSAIIDICAIFLCLVSITGLILVLFMKRRRNAGLWVCSLGFMLCCIAFWALVP